MSDTTDEPDALELASFDRGMDLSAIKTEPAQDRARALPHIIAVASGKGGVGKTSLSVNLGITLAKSGQRVCIFDADTGLANVNILLGLAPQYTLEHVLFGAKTIEEVLLTGPYGMKVIPGANGISECVTLHPRQQMRLTRELARIESEFDYLIVDTAAGIAENTLDFACSAHQTLVVITPEPTSLTDAFSLVKLLHRRRNVKEFQVVVNMANSATQAREVFHRFNAAVEKYIGITPHLIGFLLLDESLRNAVALQHPVALFPDTDPSSRSFIRLADGVRQVFDQLDPPKTGFADYWQQQFREHGAAVAKGSPKTRAGMESSPRVSPRDPNASELTNYLAELKARLLVLTEKPDVEAAQLGDLLEVVHSAYMQRYNQPAIDPKAFVQSLIERADRDDQKLRQLADQLQPWATRKVVPPPVDEEPRAPVPTLTPIVVPDIVAPAAIASLAMPELVLTPVAAAKSEPRIHGYDEHRFGSQSILLELLRRQADSGKSALELIEILR